jgi:hypothetical protein
MFGFTHEYGADVHLQFAENIDFVEDENPGAAETKIRKIY